MTSTRLIGALALALGLAACGNQTDTDTSEAGAHADHPAQAGTHDRDGHGEGEHGEGEAGQDREGEAASTVIPAAIAERSGIRVQAAGPGVIADQHEVQGLLTAPEGRVAQAAARFPGVVRTLRVNVGDRVRAGEALATIDSNLSLSRYTVTAPISGVVTARHASVGGVASEGTALLEIADLSQLWVDLHIFGADAQHIRPGVAVDVTRMGDGKTVQTTLERVLPGMATASQSTIARATLDNADGLWRPGSAVRARITVDRQPVDLLVPLAALQAMDGGDVVFVREGETYRARPVKVGLRDGERAQILSGLRAGEQVVVAESYLVKADIGKDGAAHEH
jgi:cobalt-zinc-cadmium efflux system membrane fusion protein